MNNFNPKVIFINNFSVSGATLLFSLFDNHPQIILIPTLLNFEKFWMKHKFKNTYKTISQVVKMIKSII